MRKLCKASVRPNPFLNLNSNYKKDSVKLSSHNDCPFAPLPLPRTSSEPRTPPPNMRGGGLVKGQRLGGNGRGISPLPTLPGVIERGISPLQTLDGGACKRTKAWGGGNGRG